MRRRFSPLSPGALAFFANRPTRPKQTRVRVRRSSQDGDRATDFTDACTLARFPRSFIQPACISALMLRLLCCSHTVFSDGRASAIEWLRLPRWVFDPDGAL